MQNRSNTKTATFIILVSIAVSVLQYLTCRFISITAVILIVNAALLAAGSFVLVSVTQDFEACFGFQLICLLMQLLTAVCLYPYPQRSLPDNDILMVLCILDWLVPALLCLTLYLFRFFGYFENYAGFHRNSTTVFLLAYIAFWVYGLLWNNAAYHNNYQPEQAFFSLLPFGSVASHIEAVLRKKETVSSLIHYLLSHSLPYIPYGFLLTSALKKFPVFVRLLSLSVLPILTDILQYFFRLGPADIDDMILGYFGAFLGMLCLILLHFLCRTITGHDYLEKEGPQRLHIDY